MTPHSIRSYTLRKIKAVSKTSQEHLLVLRLSAMGDVALMVPVIGRLRDSYPRLTITVVSQEKFRPMFEMLPGVIFFAADIYGRHKGLFGMYRLFQELRKNNKITAIADLHDVIRTRVLRFFFRLAGHQTFIIDKGRQEKKELTRKVNKKLTPLKTTIQRYKEVFDTAGFPFELNTKAERTKLSATDKVLQLMPEVQKVKIGIAPFAMHREKMYPLDHMEEVALSLLQKNYTIILFGGGKKELALMQEWETKYPGMVNTIGRLSFSEELILISQLDGMISMDSANMHLASLFGVPVISIWGATHPFAGFYGFGQSAENIVQAELYCRPCSVFGNKTCYRGDWACLKMIDPQTIIDKTEKMLNRK